VNSFENHFLKGKSILGQNHSIFFSKRISRNQKIEEIVAHGNRAPTEIKKSFSVGALFPWAKNLCFFICDGIILSSFILPSFWRLANASDNDSSHAKNHFNSPAAALTLQTNNLQLAPKGAFRMHTAFELRPDWQAPITRARGDLYRLGVLRFDFGISHNINLQIRGALRQVLRFDHGASANDVGDFSVATIGRIVAAGKHHPAFGVRIETKLPNTNQDRGIGTNTIDVTMSLLATKQCGHALVFADLGLAILTAPRQLNDQNDVMVYGLGLLWNLSQHLLLAAEITGFVSPRDQIPLGTEDRSAARLGLCWKLPKVVLEILAVNGLVQREGSLGVTAGVSWQMKLFKK
jgi:hypothetical protein